MVDNVLISSYIERLRHHLPRDVVDELHDGLLEEYENLRTTGVDELTAAGQVVADFGDPGRLVAEFVAQSPAKRAAKLQLLVGPGVGLSWSIALVLARAWTWQLPPAVWLAFATTLLLTITILLGAATSQMSLRRAGLARFGILSVTTLDAMGIAAALSMAGPLAWLFGIPLLASIGRMAMSMRELPRLLA